MKKSIILGLLVVAFAFGAIRGEEQKPVKIRWYGHSCFLITWPNGIKILIDPFSDKLGYDMPVPSPKPDIVLVSHEHYDHNYVEMAKGEPQVIRGLKEDGEPNPVSTFVEGVKIRVVGTYHDENMGIQRGRNAVFIMESGGATIAHLGDLGHVLTEDQVKEIGPVDILMIPVGGTYTIDAKKAEKVVELLKPKVIMPMHFKTDKISMPIAGVEPFLAGKLGVNRLTKSHVEIDKLPDTQVIYVMDYK
jgi:L-ascorbate metabolism protein UlaG (beta-lactamase superfamily)